MPKVKEEYIAGKRNTIIKCANEVFQEKPLYQITMRDIIAKTGFGQGTIYRYYENIDAIFLDSINRSTPSDTMESRIERLTNSHQTESAIVFNCVIAIGEYIQELQKTLGGKILFSLLVLYAFDPQKKESVIQKLAFSQSLSGAQSRIATYTQQNIEKGVFKPILPFDAILRFTQSAIDGIANDAAIHSIENRSDTNILEQFESLANALLYFLGATGREIG